MIKKVLIGFFAGIVSGLFASGGGMILVPTFVYVLKFSEKEARANSLICILPMVIVSGIFYYNNNYINWRVGGLVALGGILGGFVGAKSLKKIPDVVLKLAFIAFIGYVGIKMIIA